MVRSHILLCICTALLSSTNISAVVRPRKVHVSYPVDILGTHSDSYSGNLTVDKLTCFGNRDYGVPTYLETLLCMIRLPLGFNCLSIWGSRSVVVEAIGSVEFLKLSRLPSGSVFNERISLNVSRWLELTASSSSISQREVRHVPAEPIYLCARSNDWTGSQAKFHITFRPVFLRESDKLLCHSKSLVHIILVIAVTSIWLLPYIAAVVVAALSFMHGIKFVIAIISFSCCIVALTPLMLTKKNRHLARLYFNYFFTRIQAEETRQVFRQRMPVFQALFFSSALVCIGSGGSYIIYTYCGIDRELRNFLLQLTIGVASSWFVFFLCRSFERFCRDWVWVPMSVCLAQLLDLHLNPLSRDEVVAATLLISLCTSRIARASAVTPHLRTWANKVRVSLLSKTMAQQRQIGDADDPVSADEFVSMAFDQDYDQSSSITTRDYEASRDFLKMKNGAESSGKTALYSEDEGEDTVCAPVLECRSPSALRLVGREIYPSASLQESPKQQSLWQSLLPPTESPTYSSDRVTSTPLTRSGSQTELSRCTGDNDKRYLSLSKPQRISTSGSFLEFLGLSPTEKLVSREEDEDRDGDEAAAADNQVEADHRHISSPNAHCVPPTTAIQSNFKSRMKDVERNRRALSQAVNVDLSSLQLFSLPDFQSARTAHTIQYDDNRLDYEDIVEPSVSTRPVTQSDGPERAPRITSQKEERNRQNALPQLSFMTESAFSHMVGVTSAPLSALGPINLDEHSLWIPMACKDHTLLTSLQQSLSCLASTPFCSSLFPPLEDYHTSSSLFSTNSHADAIFVQRWVGHPSNLALLRSIAQGKESEILFPEDDFVLTASARGKEVKLLLKIMTFSVAEEEDLEDAGNDDEQETSQSRQHQRGDIKLPVREWHLIGLEAMKRIVLAVVEDLNELVGRLTLLSLHGTEEKNQESHFASAASVGVECTLEPRVLRALGVHSAETLLAANELYQSSSTGTDTLCRIGAAVLTALDLDSTEIHQIIAHCRVELSSVSPLSSQDINMEEASNGLGQNMWLDDSTPPEVVAPRSPFSHKSAVADGFAISVSYSMPVAIPFRHRSHQSLDELPKNKSPRSRTSSSLHSECSAQACYDLLMQCGDSGAEIHRSSKALATILLVTYVSQLVEFAAGDFFTLLSAIGSK